PVLLILGDFALGHAIQLYVQRSIAFAAHFEFAALADKHFALGSVVFGAAVDVVRIRRRPKPHFVNEHPLTVDLSVARVDIGYLLSVGELLIVVKEVFATGRGYYRGMRLHPESP